jgi:hypothetical protein
VLGAAESVQTSSVASFVVFRFWGVHWNGFVRQTSTRFLDVAEHAIQPLQTSSVNSFVVILVATTGNPQLTTDGSIPPSFIMSIEYEFVAFDPLISSVP